MRILEEKVRKEILVDYCESSYGVSSEHATRAVGQLIEFLERNAESLHNCEARTPRPSSILNPYGPVGPLQGGSRNARLFVQEP